MSLIVGESELPQELTTEQAVEAAYATELADIVDDLIRGLPVLVECDKDLVPWLFINSRNRLKQLGLQYLLLDGRPKPEDQGGMAPPTFIGVILSQLRTAVRGAVEKRVVVLPHLIR